MAAPGDPSEGATHTGHRDDTDHLSVEKAGPDPWAWPPECCRSRLFFACGWGGPMMAGRGVRRQTGLGGGGGRGPPRLDREHVVEMLKAAFVQGRLTKDEFDLRVGQALVSRTFPELAAVTADLPAGLSRAWQP